MSPGGFVGVSVSDMQGDLVNSFLVFVMLVVAVMIQKTHNGI